MVMGVYDIDEITIEITIGQHNWPRVTTLPGLPLQININALNLKNKSFDGDRCKWSTNTNQNLEVAYLHSFPLKWFFSFKYEKLDQNVQTSLESI